MSTADDCIGLPCDQPECGGVLEQKIGGPSSKIAGKAYIACGNWKWHKDNADKKGPWMLSSDAKAVGAYIRKSKSGGAPGATGSANPPAGSSTASSKRKAESYTVDDAPHGLMLDLLSETRKLVAIQQEALEFFKTEFKKAKSNFEIPEEPVDG